MTGHCVLSPRAQADLDAIWNHSESHGDRQKAERYIRQIWKDLEVVAAQPMIGRDCREVRVGYRKYRSGCHLLFYRLTTQGIDLVRILHERMDFERHLP